MSENIDSKTNKKSFGVFKFLMVLVVLTAGYQAYRYYKINLQNSQNTAELKKLDKVESDIFDFSSDKNETAGSFDDKSLDEITITELKERGAEFIYHLLLKNQLQISQLKTEMNNLRAEFARYKTEQKAVKIIFAYVDLRQKIFSDQDFKNSFQSFELLASTDKNLNQKTIELKNILANFSGAKKISENFANLIPSLVSAKNYDPNSSFTNKIRHYFATLIMVRKLDENAKTTDGAIRRVELALKENNYSEALTNFNEIALLYPEISAKFLSELQNAEKLQKTDLEIMFYLQSSINFN